MVHTAFLSPSSSTTTKEEEEEEKVSLLTTKVVDRMRRDMNQLRQILLQEEKGEEEHNSRNNHTNVDATTTTAEDDSTAPASSPIDNTMENNKITSQQLLPQSSSTSSSPPPPSSSKRIHVIRCLVLDVPLILLFVSLVVVFVMRTIWMDYYVPLMERAKRTDIDLIEEYTYYERSCTVRDITEFQQPLQQQQTQYHDSNSTQKHPTEYSISLLEDTLLQHGAVLLPQLLSGETVAQLRQYLQYKNAHLKEEEVYPMSQGYQRLSYGLESTEDIAVRKALAELTSHAQLPMLLERMFGMKDPALTELTAITSYTGAEDQVIHSDTKSDGYAAQFGRTYAHTYSLFVPMQDTVTEMGITQLCPGTHYCTNEDMAEYCEEHMVGVNQAYYANSKENNGTNDDDESEPTWKAGDGFMFNQQVWHGGSRHTDPNRPERIMFVVSFIARPQLGYDPRQLARGTYYHMRWNMWGHTWSDIANDLAASMAWPWNIFRSLALWKPRTKYWGYDLMLSAALRATNGQMGMEAEDLETFIKLKMDGLFHYPQWLQGSFSYDSETPWQTYIQQTMDKTFAFLTKANIIAVGIFLTATLLLSLTTRSVRMLSVVKRVLLLQGFVAVLAWMILERTEMSEWGMNILSGATYRRPFPVNEDFTSKRWQADPSIPDGRTTLPERMDVLFGTRYDAPFLGYYNRWLDFHPGNRIFSTAIQSRTHLYGLYDKGADSLFLTALLQEVFDEVVEDTSRGRFLQQDHLSGDWVHLSDDDALRMIRLALATESTVLSRRLHQTIKFLVADARFGRHRGSALALETTIFLHNLRDQLLSLGNPPISTSSVFSSDIESRKNAFMPKRPFTWSMDPMSTVNSQLVRSGSALFQSEKSYMTGQPVAGTLVMVFQSTTNEWRKGSIEDVVRDGEHYDVSYDDDGAYEENVTIRRIRRPAFVEEGSQVIGYLEDDQPYQGVISMVYPTGHIDIAFDDGDFATDFVPGEFDLVYPPF